MLAGIVSEQPPPIAMKDRARRQHLRVKPPTPRHQAMEDAAMPVGPIHHRGDGKQIILIFQSFTLLASGNWASRCGARPVMWPKRSEGARTSNNGRSKWRATSTAMRPERLDGRKAIIFPSGRAGNTQICG